MKLFELDSEGLGTLRFGDEAYEASPSSLRVSLSSLDRGSNGSIRRVAVFLFFSIFQAPRTKPSMRNVALTLAAERKTFLRCSSGTTRPLSAWERTRLS